MGRKKKVEEFVSAPIEEQSLDDNFADSLSKISDELVFNGLADELNYLLSLSDENKRTYKRVSYQGKKYDVIPIGVFKKSGKYILKTKKGDTIIAYVNELS